MAPRTTLKAFAFIGLALAVTLGGCGRRGSLDQPEAKPKTPASSTAATAPSTKTTASPAGPAPAGTGRTPQKSEQPISKKFPLDFLIES
ncbi:lipoprotein [Roseibium sp. RKSG952]|uniref:lipoprotein n=1 Tax=Roseibium sp. RKSG952 TaxID=2529384 RepID=UPI0012BD366A|nr:lipoprotein [Roseibium sp. RKSG952]MTH96450.1 hypothetical protein [Roseibium sp. RKSG952]